MTSPVTILNDCALEAHGLAVSVGKQSKWRLWIATTTNAITATAQKP